MSGISGGGGLFLAETSMISCPAWGAGSYAPSLGLVCSGKMGVPTVLQALCVPPYNAYMFGHSPSSIKVPIHLQYLSAKRS